MASASCPLQRAVKSIQILQAHQFTEASVGLSHVPEFTGSGWFEFRGFAGSSDPFSFRMSASVSFFFLMRPSVSRAHQS
jgi:hypothetical protein